MEKGTVPTEKSRAASQRPCSCTGYGSGGLNSAFLPLPGAALSLQCYSCSGIKDSGECQLITCPGVCFMSDMIMTMGNGESPAPRARGWVQGALL